MSDKGIFKVKEGDYVEVVLRGYATNVGHQNKQGPRLSVSVSVDVPCRANEIYARDEHVVSVRTVAPPADSVTEN